MKRGTKYFAQDGTQLAVYFKEVMTITQGVDGNFSHRGTKNMDEGGKDSGIDPAFAPYDGTITWIEVNGNKTGVLFSSDELVKTVDFGNADVNLFTYHDNDISDLKLGKKIKQGERFYEEGTAGRATGNHIHYGVSIGKYRRGYPLVENEFGNWELRNEVNPWQVFYVNDTIIRNGRGYPWKTYSNPIITPTVPIPQPIPQPVPEPIPEPTPQPVPEPTPQPVPQPAPVPEPTPQPVPRPAPTPQPILPPRRISIMRGDRVAIVGEKFVSGITIPEFLKRRTFIVNSPLRHTPFGSKVQLLGLTQWFYIKDLRKIN